MFTLQTVFSSSHWASDRLLFLATCVNRGCPFHIPTHMIQVVSSHHMPSHAITCHHMPSHAITIFGHIAMYFTDSWTVLQRVLKLGANMLLFGICTFFGQPSVSCVQAWIVDFPSVRWPFKNREQPMMNQRGWGILGVSNCCCCFLELSKAFFICLVVHLPLWKIWKSVGMIISQYMEKWKMFQTTNQYIYIFFEPPTRMRGEAQQEASAHSTPSTQSILDRHLILKFCIFGQLCRQTHLLGEAWHHLAQIWVWVISLWYPSDQPKYESAQSVLLSYRANPIWIPHFTHVPYWPIAIRSITQPPTEVVGSWGNLCPLLPVPLGTCSGLRPLELWASTFRALREPRLSDKRGYPPVMTNIAIENDHLQLIYLL